MKDNIEYYEKDGYLGVRGQFTIKDEDVYFVSGSEVLGLAEADSEEETVRIKLE